MPGVLEALEAVVRLRLRAAMVLRHGRDMEYSMDAGTRSYGPAGPCCMRVDIAIKKTSQSTSEQMEM